MKGTRAAHRYAKAILDLAREKNSAEEVRNDMDDIIKTIAGSRDLQNMLASPVVKSNIKSQALKQIFKDTHAITQGAFRILLENKRINILDVVAKQYIKLFQHSNHIQEAVVTTVVPLTDSLEAKIQDKVKELTGANARIKNILDESLLGGFVLRVGDLQYDASISNNLNELKREFKNNAYVSKI
ncbi:MAG: ATP synthase F1 subunit delta [Salegentibacter sp.]